MVVMIVRWKFFFFCEVSKSHKNNLDDQIHRSQIIELVESMHFVSYNDICRRFTWWQCSNSQSVYLSSWWSWSRFFQCLLKSPCDLDARKTFPNAPDYELKLNSGLIVHLAAVRSGEGKIDVGITYTDVHQVQCCTTPRFAYRYCHRRRDASHKKIQFHQCLRVECAHFSPYKMVTRRARRCWREQQPRGTAEVHHRGFPAAVWWRGKRCYKIGHKKNTL